MVFHLFVLFLLSLFDWSDSREYWVRPDSTPSCGTKQPCLTLSTVAGNTTAYFTSHSVFHFLPGSHTINVTTRMTVFDVDSVSFVGSSLGTQYSTVECNGRMSFSFVSTRYVTISNLEFLACGLVTHVFNGRRFLGLSSFKPNVALLFLNCSSVMLEKVRVRNSYGYGLLESHVHKTNLTNFIYHERTGFSTYSTKEKVLH